MRLCFLCKYPPIEGGVSAQTYWLARGLAEKGHEIHLVTNADEVEETYRLTLAPDDAAWYQPEFAASGGRVRVYNAEPFSRPAMFHIPQANPFVSKLASVATDIVRRHRCEAVLAYYYEPYAVAGALVSCWTGLPLIVKHAGSDLDRLFHIPDLAATYKEMLRSAAAVVTQPRLMPRFLGLGVRRHRLEADVPYSLPADVFHPAAEPLDIEGAALPLETSGAAAPDAGVPVIGAYGKIGTSKGTFDLIAALGGLAREGLDFRFAAMIGRAQGESLEPALRQAGILERTRILPMLPNWKVPAFLRACTAVCFLERDFPVAIHGPVIPREVLACGTCLVLSGEIASKQRYRDQLMSGDNVLVVEDPRNHAELAAALRSVLSDPRQARAIGERGVRISRSLEDYGAFVAGWERLLARHGGGEGAAAARRSAPADTDPAAELAVLIPDLLAFLRRECGPVVDEFAFGPSREDPYDTAIRFCDFVAGRLGEEAFGAERPKVLTCLSYAKARLIAAHDPAGRDAPVFAVCDRLGGAPVSREEVGHLRPVRGNAVRIEMFDYDVSGLGILASVGGHPPIGADDADFAALQLDPTQVLFHRSANLIPCELRIDDSTRELVDACDGSLTTAEVIERMCRYFGAETPPEREEVAAGVVAALARMYRSGVLVFGEHRPGWGWTGGSRGIAEESARGAETAGVVEGLRPARLPS